jgi:cyanophycinase-like exopeptidase
MCKMSVGETVVASCRRRHKASQSKIMASILTARDVWMLPQLNG